MSRFIPWDSQPLDEWSRKYAPGKTIDLDGWKTHYIEMGSGEPLILVHGFNYDSYTWVSNLEELARDHKVYALDLWGMGFSTREPLDYGFGLYSRQILRFMEALEIKKASFVGHSMGGGILIFFSLHNTDRVEKLVLVDSVGVPTSLPLRAKMFQLPVVSEFLLGLKTNYIRRKNLESNWIFNTRLITDAYFEEATRFQKIEGTTRSLLSILRKDFFNTLDDEIKALGRKSVPTLIVWGRESTMPPLQCAEEMHRNLPGSRLEILDNAGHLSNFDQSQKFNKLVRDFLLSTEPSLESSEEEEQVPETMPALSFEG